MNKVLILFVLVGIGGTLFATAFAPASVPVKPGDVRAAKEYNLERVEASFFVGCRKAFDERSSVGRMGGKLGLSLPEIRDGMCSCIAKEVGTPSDIRLIRITEKLIEAAVWGSRQPRDDKLKSAIVRESLKAVVTGASERELRSTLRSIMVAQRTCVKRMRAAVEG
jgi:hypothetical protein